MKVFKNINISSDGSLYFSYSVEATLDNRLISFQKQDDKNFSLNQKKRKKTVESKYSSYYKKKYLR